MSTDFNTLKAQYDRLTLLYQVSETIHSTLESEAALQLIVNEAVKAMRATSGSVVLINPNTGLLEIQASMGLPAEAKTLKLRVGEGITGVVAREGRPVRVGDTTTNAAYVRLRPDVRSELAVPLEVNGEVRGVLNVDSNRPDAFTEADQELLQELARLAADVIRNTWLYEQFRHKARLFEALTTVSRTINSAISLDDALNAITREACDLMRAKMCSLMLLDESLEWLDLRASHGASKQYRNKPRLSVGESFVGVVVRRKKPLQLEIGFAAERAAAFQQAGDWRAQCLHRTQLQFFQRGDPHSVHVRGAVGHRHREGAALRARGGHGGTAAAERKVVGAGIARGGGGARDPQSAHGDEDAVSLARFAVRRE